MQSEFWAHESTFLYYAAILDLVTMKGSFIHYYFDRYPGHPEYNNVTTPWYPISAMWLLMGGLKQKKISKSRGGCLREVPKIQ